MTTMWKTLHQLAAPPRLYQICGRLVPWLAAAGIIALATGWVRALVSPRRTTSRGGLPHYVPACPGGHLVNGYLCGDGGGGVYRAGLADENGHPCRRGDGAGGGGVHLHRAGHRRGMGQTDVGHWWVWDARLTSELVLLFLYAGVIALWHAFDDRKMAGRAAGILVLVGVVNLPVIHYSVEWWNTLHRGSTRMQQSIDPAMRSPLRWAIAGYLLLFMTLALMRMRNLILLMEKRRPWVSELILKRGTGESGIFIVERFFAMGGYAFCLAGGGDDRGAAGAAGAAHGAAAPGHSARRGAAAGARGADARRTGATGGGVNLRRKTGYGWSARCWRAGLTTATVLYALRANIDLFYTPAKSSTASARRSICRRRASACASAGW